MDAHSLGISYAKFLVTGFRQGEPSPESPLLRALSCSRCPTRGRLCGRPRSEEAGLKEAEHLRRPGSARLITSSEGRVIERGIPPMSSLTVRCRTRCCSASPLCHRATSVLVPTPWTAKGAASQGVGLKQKRAEEASFVCGKEPLLEGEGAGIHHPPGIAKDPESNCHAAVACGPAGIAPRLVSEHVGDRSIPLLVSRASDAPQVPAKRMSNKMSSQL